MEEQGRRNGLGIWGPKNFEAAQNFVCFTFTFQKDKIVYNDIAILYIN